MREAVIWTLALLALPVAVRATGGEISGWVTLDGSPPLPKTLPNSRDVKACGKSVSENGVLVSGSGQLQNAIVYVKDIAADAPPPEAATATLDQVKCAFLPRVQAVRAGAILTVINSDAVLHNVHAFYGASTVFNAAMPIVHQKITKKLDKPGFIRLKCDVHAWMGGAIGVMPTGHFAVTAADGSFRIEGVPAGHHTLGVWHERLGEKEQAVDVPETGAVEAQLSFPASAAAGK